MFSSITSVHVAHLYKSSDTCSVLILRAREKPPPQETEGKEGRYRSGSMIGRDDGVDDLVSLM